MSAFQTTVHMGNILGAEVGKNPSTDGGASTQEEDGGVCGLPQSPHTTLPDCERLKAQETIASHHMLDQLTDAHDLHAVGPPGDATEITLGDDDDITLRHRAPF
jgi:hypothetical protein